MEEDKPQENTENKPNPKPLSPPPIEPKTPANQNQGSCSNPNNSEESYKRKEYRISVINTITNIAVGIATVFLFSLAFYQNDLVKDSSNAALKAAESAKEQVDLIKDQFELEHRPYLTVKNISKIEFRKGSKVKINFNFVNLGKYPITIIKTRGTAFVSMPEVNRNQVVASFKEMINSVEWIPSEAGYIYDYSVPAWDEYGEVIEDVKFIESIKTKKIFLNWGIEVIYQDAIVKKPFKMTLITQIIEPNDPIQGTFFFYKNDSVQ
jgi:hypothetical protein